MGKIRTKVLGSEEEKIQKQKDEARREGKKEKKMAKLAGKGGGKIVDLSADEVIDTDKIVEQAVKDIKAKKEAKGPKPRGAKFLEKAKLVDKNKLYSTNDAVKLVKQTSYSKFIGSVEVHINVKEKGLRGIVTLPHGSGKQIKVVIADDKIVETIQNGKIDFDILVAHPQMMPKLARVARILGPKGLMPNPKAGTISTEPEKVAKKFSGGELQWKTETEAPIVHFVIGKADFEEKKLKENLEQFIKAIGPLKINSVFLKATMGPSIKVDTNSGI